MPCVVYGEGEVNVYQLADELNDSNDTYAKRDLFDVLYKIGKLKDEGRRGKEIAETFGWTETKARDYSTLLSKVAPLIKISKSHQIGRATEKVAYATFDFTKGWFRTSRLYGLNEDFQLLFFEKFKANGFNLNKRFFMAKYDYRVLNSSDHSVEKMSTRFLDMALICQIGRVKKKFTCVNTFDFTEYWFRTSGLMTCGKKSKKAD